MTKSFRLAPMSPVIRAISLALFLLPFAFLAGALIGTRSLAFPGLAVASVYAWIWLRFRPTWFLVHPDKLEVIWPLKRRILVRHGIQNVRLINAQDLQREIGWGLRVGAGGLWGGFGWLWTKRRGIVQMYVSRTDRFVWIERNADRPWLITPEQPEAFVHALSTKA